MASHGKHAKQTQPVRVGKHGVMVQPRISMVQLFIILAIIAALVVIPASIAFKNKSLDVQAFADLERTAFSALDDSTDQNAVAFPTEHVNYAANVVEKDQNYLMAGGCELVSLSIVFDSMGFDIGLDEFVDEYLDIDGHFGTGYSGSPYSMGGGYPPGIVTAANRYLASMNANVRAHNLTGLSMDELRTLVNAGYPVLVWSTMELDNPSFTDQYDDEWEWYDNEHCVVVYGFERGTVLVSDPLEGFVVRDLDRFTDVYEQCGSMAVGIY